MKPPDEKLVGLNVPLAPSFKADLAHEAKARDMKRGPFARTLLEEGWELYQLLGREKFTRYRGEKSDRNLEPQVAIAVLLSELFGGKKAAGS